MTAFILITVRNSRQGNVPDLNVLIAPLVEQLDAANLVDDVLGQDRRYGLYYNLAGIRHIHSVWGKPTNMILDSFEGRRRNYRYASGG